MAAHYLQIKYLQKLFHLILPLFLVACISAQPYPRGIVEAQPQPTPVVRPPRVGQEWVYQVRNVFNQEIVDIITEKVVSVGDQIRITRSGVKAGQLPDEIQSPWGYIVQDPHWSPPQKFSPAVPLWPTQLNTQASGFYQSRYQELGYPDGSYYWGLNLNPIQWERLKVGAGQFLTLKYHNEIPYFQSQDVFRVANYREEDIWFSPEIGRWVIRRSFGRYLLGGMRWNGALWEDYLEWELISWK
jgi:hypothetical protein